MRIPLNCLECWMDEEAEEAASDAAAVARGETPPKRLPYRVLKPEDHYLADIEEDNAYVQRCRNGHVIKVSLHNVRHELLYESGVVAALLGFHREAVSSVAAAVERFFEFAMEVFTLHAGIDESTHDAVWKQVRKQSERQFGAFLFLYAVNYQAPFLSGKAWSQYEQWVSFRNEVIHQGRFPSQNEVMQYARYVFELIRDTRTKLDDLGPKNIVPTAVHKIQMRHALQTHRAVEAKAGAAKLGEDDRYLSAGSSIMPLMLNLVNHSVPMNFDARLAEAKENMWRWGFPTKAQPG